MTKRKIIVSAVHREQLVVASGESRRSFGPRELGAHHAAPRPRRRGRRRRGDDVADADPLVVDGRERRRRGRPAPPTSARAARVSTVASAGSPGSRAGPAAPGPSGRCRASGCRASGAADRGSSPRGRLAVRHRRRRRGEPARQVRQVGADLAARVRAGDRVAVVAARAEEDLLAALERRASAAAAPACSASRASARTRARGSATTTKAMFACWSPQNSAHWPRKTPRWSASKTTVVRPARDHVDLPVELRHPEAVDHVPARDLDPHRYADRDVDLVRGADVRRRDSDIPEPLPPGNLDRQAVALPAADVDGSVPSVSANSTARTTVGTRSHRRRGSTSHLDPSGGLSRAPRRSNAKATSTRTTANTTTDRIEHDPPEAGYLVGRAALRREGRLVVFGTAGHDGRQEEEGAHRGRRTAAAPPAAPPRYASTLTKPVRSASKIPPDTPLANIVLRGRPDNCFQWFRKALTSSR